MNKYSYERGVVMNNVELCDVKCVHKEEIKNIHIPNDEVLYDVAELFKVFGDSTRVRILYVLFEKEVCVCDIAELLKMNQSAISHQLRILKQANLVKNRRDGKTIYYSLKDNHVVTIFKQAFEHVIED